MSELICVSCKEEIEKDRIEALIDLDMGLPDQCKSCASKLPPPRGVMAVEGKTGSGQFIKIDPLNKSQESMIMNQHTRGPQRCSSG